MRRGPAGLHKPTSHRAQAGNATNAGARGRTAVVLAESTFAACCTGEKPSPAASTACSPSTHLCAQLSAQGACQAGSAPASTGAARAARGALLGTRAGTEGDGRKSPIAGKGKGCRLHRNRALRATAVSMAQRDGQQSPGALCCPSSGHPGLCQAGRDPKDPSQPCTDSPE